MNFGGHIPARVVYTYGQVQELSTPWDDLADVNAAKTTVTPCYVSDVDSAKSRQSGADWARWRGGHKSVETLERANEPFAVRVCGLEKRDRGGRAYKVVSVEGNYYFDLREDVMLDTLLCAGCKDNGHLQGLFVWAVIGSQMKLVRIGSALHQAAIEAGKRRASANVKAKDLKAGGVYLNRKGERFIFLGTVNTMTYEMKYSERKSTGLMTYREPVPISLTCHPLKAHLLMVKIPDYAHDRPVSKFLEDTLTERNYFYVEFKKTVAVVECREEVVLPEDLFPRLRKMGLDLIARAQKSDNPTAHCGDAICRADLSNVTPVSEGPCVSAGYRKYLTMLDGMVQDPPG